MRTVYLRNVPDGVVERLEELANREGMSVSAFAARELSIVARRADNPALLADLPDLGVSVDPHLVDSEVAQALRSQVRRSEINVDQATRALDAWGRVGIRRVAAVGLLSRIWALRDNLTAYHATYVAVAEAMDLPLLRADGRLARASGPRCPFLVVRS